MWSNPSFLLLSHFVFALPCSNLLTAKEASALKTYQPAASKSYLSDVLVVNHADRLALFTSNKLSEMFSTRTKAWNRLSNTHADQIIAQRIIFCIFHNGITCTFACNGLNTLFTKIFDISARKKKIKAHVPDGAGADFLWLPLPRQWAGLRCPQRPVPAPHMGLCCSLPRTTGSAQPQLREHSTRLPQVRSGTETCLLYTAWEFPPTWQSVYTVILLFFLCFSLAILVVG